MLSSSSSSHHHFLNLVDAGTDELKAMLQEASRRKALRQGKPHGLPDHDRPLVGYTLAMIFEKPSTRTRVSFDMAMRQLGGDTIVLDSGTMQLGRGETIADTARVLSRYIDAIMIRTDDHQKVVEMARYSTVPVINGLTDFSHPCQIMATLLTVVDHLEVERGTAQLPKTRWAWLGDGNNVLHSLIEASSLMDFKLDIACPHGYGPNPEVINTALQHVGADLTIPPFRLVPDPKQAAAGADVIVTDTWTSMGQDHNVAKLSAMQPYQVTPAMMALAAPGALFMHCLPAHRGEEVLDDVIDGPQSTVWEEAENRVHAQKAILLWCFNKLPK